MALDGATHPSAHVHVGYGRDGPDRPHINVVSVDFRVGGRRRFGLMPDEHLLRRPGGRLGCTGRRHHHRTRDGRVVHALRVVHRHLNQLFS